MPDKRCYNTNEALHYLGIKRRSFERHLRPLLAGKGVKIGVSTVYEKTDLDAAWDAYKESVSTDIEPHARQPPTAAAPSKSFDESAAEIKKKAKRR
jgi:hypothetical protein